MAEPVTYFVRMVAKPGEAERVLELLLENKEAIRPLVDPDSVIFGNTQPIKVLGYSVP